MFQKFIYSFYLFCFSVHSVQAQQGSSKHYDLAALLNAHQLITTAANETHALPNTVAGAIATKGVVWLEGVSFKEGSIAIDLRGKNVFQQSFLGIAFHGLDTTNYEALYFRPFNFHSADTLRKKHTVQYISMPGYPWYKLRQEQPLVYENAVNPFPEPEEWFHAEIVVKGDSVTVYVNHSPIPSLKVRELDHGKGLKIGLWADGLAGDFADLTIKFSSSR